MLIYELHPLHDCTLVRARASALERRARRSLDSDGRRLAMTRQAGAVCPTLGGMPADVIQRVTASIERVRDLAAANAASRLFRGAPGGCSPVERALRERALARGHKSALPPTLPAGVCTWTEELFARERVLACARAHAAVVAAGSGFSAFVDAEGGLHTCGEEEEADEVTRQLTGEYLAHAAIGHSGMHSVCVPTHIASLSAVRVVAVAASHHHLVALSEAGAVYGCGNNENGQLGLGDAEERHEFEPIVALVGVVVMGIAAGDYHSLALTAAGCAYSWGCNSCGQLGHGDRNERWEPTRIEAPDGVRIGGVAAGQSHTLLLSAHGVVYSCGDGFQGQLGHGDQQQQHTPRRIEALACVRTVHVSAGCRHSLAVDAEGGVRSFGEGYGGCLGHGDQAWCLLPKRIEALAGVRAISARAGALSSAVLGADGSVHAFGHNSSGRLGLDTPGMDVYQPTRVAALAHARVVECAFGPCHALFATEAGVVYACGEKSAALGLGLSTGEDPIGAADRPDQAMPVRIEQLPRVPPRRLSG